MKRIKLKEKTMLDTICKEKSMSNIIKERGIVYIQQNNAITLIALIITIIVLLILAGVILNMTIGEDGIINKAQLAKEKTNKSQKYENEHLNNIENYLGNVREDSSKDKIKLLWEGNQSSSADLKLSDKYINFDAIYTISRRDYDDMYFTNFILKDSYEKNNIIDRPSTTSTSYYIYSTIKLKNNDIAEFVWGNSGFSGGALEKIYGVNF